MGRRAKPGRFGSLAFAMKNRHFGKQCSWRLAGKARKCGRFWAFACVSQILVNKTVSSKCQETKHEKKLPNRPVFTHVHLEISPIDVGGKYWNSGPVPGNQDTNPRNKTVRPYLGTEKAHKFFQQTFWPPPKTPHFPKGHFRTKNATALNSEVRSVLLSP